MYSRREFTRIACAAVVLPFGRSTQSAARDAATVRGVKIGAITGVYGPFTPAVGQDVTDVVIARSLEGGIGHVELVNTLYEPCVTGGAVGGQAPASPPSISRPERRFGSGGWRHPRSSFAASGRSSTPHVLCCTRLS